MHAPLNDAWFGFARLESRGADFRGTYFSATGSFALHEAPVLHPPRHVWAPLVRFEVVRCSVTGACALNGAVCPSVPLWLPLPLPHHKWSSSEERSCPFPQVRRCRDFSEVYT